MSRVKIVISADALDWFKEEMEVVPGDSIKFFARYGGVSTLHDGFSLGVTKEEPDEVSIEVQHNDVRYYMENRDIWFLLGHELHVNVDPELGELIYSYKKS